MVTHTIKESAAASAVNTNLTAGDRIQRSGRPRRVTHLGLVGSAAIGDAAVELFYGDTFVGRFYNTHAGANLVALADSDMMPVGQGLILPPNEDLNVFIVDAGATNVLSLTLIVEELPMPRPSFSRRY